MKKPYWRVTCNYASAAGGLIDFLWNPVKLGLLFFLLLVIHCEVQLVDSSDRFDLSVGDNCHIERWGQLEQLARNKHEPSGGSR